MTTSQLAIFTLLILSTEGAYCKIVCKSSGIACLDWYTYQLCMNGTNQQAIEIGKPGNCPDGTICDDEGFFACKVGTVPTTTPAPTTLPPCSGPAKFATTICNQYLECIQAVFWWIPQTQTCPKGQNFDPILGSCSENYSCGEGVSTVAPIVQCTGAGNLPGPTIQQYYECQFIWFQWQPVLKDCLVGQIFDVVTSHCVDVVTKGTTVLV